MEILRYVFIIVEVLCSVMLIGLILLQKSKGGGLGGAFGGGMGESLFGSRAGNVLTRATVILGIVFLLNTVFLAVIHSGSGRRSLMERFTGGSAASRAAQQAGRPAQQPAGQPAQQPAGGAQVPTLPGASLDEQPAAAQAPAPSTAPATVTEPSLPETASPQTGD
jgi:preprotein translocase subunit SecG